MYETTEKLWTHDLQQNELTGKGGDSKHPGVQWLDRITKYYHSNGPETNSGTRELTSSVPAVVPAVSDAVKNEPVFALV